MNIMYHFALMHMLQNGGFWGDTSQYEQTRRSFHYTMYLNKPFITRVNDHDWYIWPTFENKVIQFSNTVNALKQAGYALKVKAVELNLNFDNIGISLKIVLGKNIILNWKWGSYLKSQNIEGAESLQ